MIASGFAPARLFSVGEYHRMAAAGILHEDGRVELIEGRVVLAGPIGSRHAACVEKLAALIRATLPVGTSLRIQNPVRLSDSSEPQPDLAIVVARDDYYASAHPAPDDVRLIIEVADASVMYDRHTKLPLYARSGIAEVWLVDLVRNVIELHSGAREGRYTEQREVPRGALISSSVEGLTIASDSVLIG